VLKVLLNPLLINYHAVSSLAASAVEHWTLLLEIAAFEWSEPKIWFTGALPAVLC